MHLLSSMTNCYTVLAGLVGGEGKKVKIDSDDADDACPSSRFLPWNYLRLELGCYQIERFYQGNCI